MTNDPAGEGAAAPEPEATDPEPGTNDCTCRIRFTHGQETIWRDTSCPQHGTMLEWLGW